MFVSGRRLCGADVCVGHCVSGPVPPTSKIELRVSQSSPRGDHLLTVRAVAEAPGADQGTQRRR